MLFGKVNPNKKNRVLNEIKEKDIFYSYCFNTILCIRLFSDKVI